MRNTNQQYWRSIDTYILPTEEWDFDTPKILCCDNKGNIVIARCIASKCWEDEPMKYRYEYDSEGFTIIPTHWQPLPLPPSTEVEIVFTEIQQENKLK